VARKADEQPVRLAEAMAGAAAAAVGTDVAAAVATVLHELGVRWAFGVCGGAIARMWAALLESPIEVVHCRHESGAGFAAIEASVLGAGPAALFTTTGPGLTNAVTALTAARVEGAKLILLSPRTSAALRGRTNVQETSAYDEPLAGLFRPTASIRWPSSRTSTPASNASIPSATGTGELAGWRRTFC
jgi:thiamine pyrophosphate-dependent acetolactate synthase large subunit-like protein